MISIMQSVLDKNPLTLGNDSCYQQLGTSKMLLSESTAHSVPDRTV